VPVAGLAAAGLPVREGRGRGQRSQLRLRAELQE
jgi:hypothetical protein